MTRWGCAVVTGFLLLSCGKQEASDRSAGNAAAESGAQAKLPTPATAPVATEDAQARPAPALASPAAPLASGDSGDSAETSAPEESPADVFGFKMSSFDFLGWTDDGSYFALAATHSEEPGEGIEPWRVELNQVHDALTGRVVDSYRIASKFPKAGDKNADYWPEKRVRAAWQRAKPRAEWKSWLAAHPLVESDPTTSAQGWKISAKLVAGSVRKQHKFEIETRAKGFYTHWDLGGAAYDDWDDPKLARLMKIKPRIAITTAKGAESWKSITYHLPFINGANADDTYGLMGIGREHWDNKTSTMSSEPVIITGSMRPFWSPQGDRLVWAMYHSFAGVPKALRAELGIAHFYVRTPGPQIRLVDAGIGDGRARAQAARFAKAGLPITVLGTAKKAGAASEIYYRGAPGKAVAERVAAVLGGDLAIKELKQPGYLDVVIVLAP